MLWCSPVVALAQIRVIESGGEDVQNVGPTVVEFRLDEREKGPTIPIYLVLSQSVAVATGPGGSASAVGQTYSKLLDAPGRVELDGGVYRFGLSENAMFNRVFDVQATGGVQTWAVSRGHPGRQLGGFIGSVVTLTAGLSLAVIGAAISPLDDVEGGMDLGEGLLIAGAGWTAVGAGIFVPITMSSRARAERVTP
jgi:hypothetical protein